jgi:hypothetical protein
MARMGERHVIFFSCVCFFVWAVFSMEKFNNGAVTAVVQS